MITFWSTLLGACAAYLLLLWRLGRRRHDPAFSEFERHAKLAEKAITQEEYEFHAARALEHLSRTGR